MAGASAAPQRAHRVLGWLKGQPVLLVSAAAALLSMAAVPPSPAYAGYFDRHTLLCLFSMLAVLNGLRQLGAFRILAARLVQRFASLRSVVLVMVMVTFFGSMLLTNDMALLTFLPLSAMVLSSCGHGDKILFTFVMQTLAANLGGMILPFGNPQNLFLFSHYQLGLGEFVAALLPAFTASLVLIVACCLAGAKPLRLELVGAGLDGHKLEPGRFAALMALFALVIAMVFRLVPALPGSIGVCAALLALGCGEALRRVDYALLATFCCFFVFSGNLAAVPAVQELLGHLLQGGAFVPSLLASQLISNVPAAILLAPFTQDWSGLLLGVDIGGVGTVVASLASLITLAEYNKCLPGNTARFLAVFSAYNLAFLAVLAALTLLLP
ncbi:MAG: SLC13 family permease [Coriobacteriales bacterium]